ncbi:MAG TPA: hypothetical protein DEB23_05900 [Chitinophagaceae bacterium]|nr:hypothetical protein [Chitinophagaceae bacterium]
MEEKLEMNFTGERLVTKVFEYWTLEHLHRYAISTDFVKNKVVLDLASGEGYGSNLLSKYAHSVVGIDISEEAIKNSVIKYQRSNLKFLLGSAYKIPLESESIDVVVSFETIEHHDQHEEMMSEVKRVLKNDGILIISSPDKKNYSDIPKYTNPYHVKELYTEEFHNLIEQYFQNTYMLYQKSIFGSIISSREINSNGLKEFIGNYSALDSFSQIQNPVYNICIASQSSLQDFQLNTNSIFFNNEIISNYINANNELEVLKSKYIEVENILNSNSYKLGRFFTYPIRSIKKYLQKS